MFNILANLLTISFKFRDSMTIEYMIFYSSPSMIPEITSTEMSCEKCFEMFLQQPKQLKFRKEKDAFFSYKENANSKFHPRNGEIIQSSPIHQGAWYVSYRAVAFEADEAIERAEPEIILKIT